MSNPWSQAYEDLRKPYLEGKMAKKDYDGDGKVESGKDEWMGSRDKAIKKDMGKKVAKEHHQKDADGKVIEHEDTTPSSVEENVDESVQQAVQVLDELSKKTLNQYTYDAAERRGREKGIKMASKKLGKAKSARTVRKQKEDEDKGREVGHSRQEGPDRDANRSHGKPRQPYKKYMKKDKAAAEARAKKSGGFGNKATYGENVDEMITLTKGDYASRNVAGSAYANAAKKKFDSKIYKAGGGLGSNFLPLANSHEPEGDVIDEKKKDLPTTKMYRKAGNLSRDALSKGLDSKEGSKAQDRSSKIVRTISTAKKKTGNPAFDDPSHHSNALNKEGYQRNPEKDPEYNKDNETFAQKRKRRMNDPKTGINSPAFKKFMADKDKGSSAKTKAKRDKMVKKESFSDWRSDFIWEDGDSVKKT